MKLPPKFTGSAMSGMVRVPGIEGTPQLWAWVPRWGHGEHTDYLTIQAIQKGKPPHALPVVLSFSIESNPDPETIYMLNPLPVPQFGEYGLVEHRKGQELVNYHIMQLSLEARQRWVALGEALRRLSAPLLWPAFTQRHQTAANDLIYNRELQAIQTKQVLAIGDTKNQLIVQGAMLMAAHQHIQELQEALKKEDWVQQWEEIQGMMHQLAHDYYEHHLQQTTSVAQLEIVQTPLPLEVAPAPAPAKQKKPRATRTRRPPTEIVARRSNTISLSSDVLNREIINALRDKSTYRLHENQALAEHKHRFDKDKGQLIITIHPLEGEGFETVLHALNTLGDGCIDTYIAVMAIAIDKNGTERIHTPIPISPDDILELCGKKKSNGSYTPFQRAEIIKHLKTLSQTRIIATMPGRPPSGRGKRRDNGTVLRAEGALINLLSFRIGEYHTITGEEVWEKRSIAIGEWATMIPELNSKTATMLRQVLTYSAKNERYQKRLGVYLTFMFRINAKRINAAKGIFPNDISMGALLEGAGIVPEKQHPGRFYDAIMVALERLKSDKVTGGYWQVVDSSEVGQQISREIQERAKGWADLFLQTKWNFSAPEHLKEQYQKLIKPAP